MLKRIYTSLVLTVLFCLTYAAYAEEPILVIEPQGHSAMINEVIFIPDGTSLISVSDDKTIRLWDVESGELRETLRGQIGDGPEGKLYAAALSPNGAILAAGGYTQNDEIRLFRVTDGKQIGFLKGHDNVIYALAFSPDSRRLASGSMDKTVRVWDVSPLTDSGQRPKEKTDGTDHFTGEALAILEGHDDSVYGIAFSQDGTKLISVADDDIGILWDWKSR